MALVEINANGASLSAWFVHKAHALLIQRGFRDKHGPYIAVVSLNQAPAWSEIKKQRPTFDAIFKELPLTYITRPGAMEIRKPDGTVLAEITNLGESHV